jgi:hypothetical protein
MGQSLAKFRELQGIGPATEARLHQAGIYSWEALATAAAALASVRGNGDSMRDVANAVAARRAEAGEGRTGPRPPDGAERLEAFVLRMSLMADGEPQRSEVTHVRTRAERAWAGWRPAELADFVQEHARLRMEPAPPEVSVGKEAASDDATARRRPDSTAAPPSSADHVVVLDAGKAIGGASRDIDFVVTNTRSAGGDFDYRATLSARQLGHAENGEEWTTVASQIGTCAPDDELALGFAKVPLPPGVQRLQVRLEVRLSTPTSRPPALVLASD